jgi:hypothetical protein
MSLEQIQKDLVSSWKLPDGTYRLELYASLTVDTRVLNYPFGSQVAIASFFEGEQSDHEIEDRTPPPSDVPNLVAQLNRGVPQPATGPAKPGAARTGPATLDSLRQDEDSSDEDDQGEAFFAGGI